MKATEIPRIRCSKFVAPTLCAFPVILLTLGMKLPTYSTGTVSVLYLLTLLTVLWRISIIILHCVL